MTNSYTSTASNYSTQSSQGGNSRIPKTVSFEDSGIASSGTVSENSLPKRSRKEFSTNTTIASNDVMRKEKKFRGMKSAGFFGADGKYSDFKIIDPDEVNECEKKIDEIMPLLHQTTISCNDEKVNKKVTQQMSRREKDKSNNRNSNRKKLKLTPKKSENVVVRKSTSHNSNEDSDSA